MVNRTDLRPTLFTHHPRSLLMIETPLGRQCQSLSPGLAAAGNANLRLRALEHFPYHRRIGYTALV